MATINEALAAYLDSLQLARSAHTARTYANAAKSFRKALQKHGLQPSEAPCSGLSEEAITWLVKSVKDLSPATERLYVQAMAGFYEFVAAERLADVNLPRLRLLIRQRARRPGIRLPQFPADDIARLLQHAASKAEQNIESEQERLRALRDRAFLLTLADTGLRVHEACKLRRGDLDRQEHQAVIIGKGDKQALVRFSERSVHAIGQYLEARATLDGASGKPLASLPLFARHDKGAGKKIKSIGTGTGRNIVHVRAQEALGKEASKHITPHSLRHYFVTAVLRGERQSQDGTGTGAAHQHPGNAAICAPVERRARPGLS